MSDAFGQIIIERGLKVPAVVARFHAAGSGRYKGQAEVEAGNALARLIARLAGFPPAGHSIPFEILVEPQGQGHLWRRCFGRSQTLSHLRYDSQSGCAIEGFGPFRFYMDLRLLGETLAVDVSRMEVLGLPLPRWLTPRSAAREFEAVDGEFGFDISASLPLVGMLIRYRGSFPVPCTGIANERAGSLTNS
ncbi:DUF4166 domain-containing protein [Pseudophaeobacter sp.]|uniref:DUF4166 domain-containing protein n=1 Tax=Pseudophaeobacter sp. TaxID=1971739 RepID=UPI00405A4295